MKGRVVGTSLGCLCLAACLLIELRGQGEGDSVSFARLYSDSDGITHFVDEQLSWTAIPGDIRSATTERRDSQNFSLWRNTSGLDADWHPAGQKQFVLVLKGSLEVQAGDGETRTFAPGKLLLVEDVAGKGHQSRNVGDGELLMALIGVP